MRGSGFSIVNYSDDFLLIGRTKKECSRAQFVVIELLIAVGFCIKWEKLVGPTNQINFLGIIIDSKKGCIELSSDKLAPSRIWRVIF